MANRFLNNITINDEYTLPSADGTADQIITTDGSGQLSFVDQNTINAGNAEHVVIYAKNTHTASIAKGTPVYITGTVGATDTVEIAPADAGNSAKMPAVGLLDATLAVNAFGYVITGGFMDNITTDPIDGATPTSNDTVYVKVGGGLTLTKPTGPTGLIQNVAKVGKVSGGNSGSLIVSSILRTNDVPNLTTGKIWVGSAANTIESATVHLDEANGRMGIGTTNPTVPLLIQYTDTHTSGDLALANSALDIYNDSSNDVVGKGSTITFSDTYSGSNKTTRAAIKGGTDTAGNTADGFLAFYTDSGGANSMQEHMRIDNDGEVLIGTTTPTGAKLLVDHTSTKMLELKRSGATKARFIADSNHGQLDLYNSATTNSIRLLANGDSFLNGGNVGIGTTSPGEKLDVSGNAKVSGYFYKTSDASATVVRTSRSDDSQEGLLRTDGWGNFTFNKAVGIGYDTDGVLGGAGVAGQLLVSSKIGIGTASPDTPLHVDLGTVDVKAQLDAIGGFDGMLVDGTNASYNLIGGNGDKYTLGALNDGSFRIYNEGGAGYALTLNNSGKLGIGTTDPQEKLDISAGSIRLDDGLSIKWGTIDANRGRVRITGNEANDFLQFVTDNSEKMRLTNTGLGIGTTSPAQKLDVAGSIRTNSNLYVYNSDLSKQALRVFAEATTNTGILKLSNGSNWGLLMRGESNNPYIGSYYNGTLNITGFEDSTGTTTSAIKLAQFVFGGTGGGSGYLTLNGDLRINTNKKIKFQYANSQENGIEWVAGSKISAAITPVDTANFSRTGLGFFTGDFSDGTTNADERMRITREGNVGIGTTSPTTALHINANAPTIRLQDATSGDNHYFTGNNGELRVQTSGYMTMRPGNTVSTTFLANGNVGIGTTSPGAKLEVSGDLKISSDQTNLIKISNESNEDYFNISQSTNNKPTLSLGDIDEQYGTLLTVDVESEEVVIFTNGTVTVGDNGFGNSTQFIVDDVNEKFTFTNGNVGIGTTSPASILHLKSNTSTLTLESSDTGLDPDQVWASLDFKQNDASQTPVGSVANISAIAKAGNTNFGNLLFQTKPRPADAYNDTLFLSSSGNIGINTTSPSDKLEVNDGDVLVSNDSINQYKWQYGSNQPVWSVGGGNYFTIKGGGNRFVTLNSSGNFGIGTTSPSKKLDVTGDIRALKTTGTASVIAEKDGNFAALNADGTSGFISYGNISNNRVLRIVGNGLEVARFDTSGNVGIGTTSPATKLHVLGESIRTGVDASNYVDISSTSTSTSFSTVGNGFIAPDIIFNINTTNRLTIDGTTGNVGIGTATPSEKLEVDGNVQAETLIATDLTDGYVPWSRNGTVGLQDSEIYQDNGQVGIGTTTLSQALNVNGDVLADGYRLSAMQTAPSSKGDTGTLGEIRITADYIYVCYATNSWRRVALAAW